MILISGFKTMIWKTQRIFKKLLTLKNGGQIEFLNNKIDLFEKKIIENLKI